jgi:radical SAM superfamily enzyme YgiQ (UPF0313 family)
MPGVVGEALQRAEPFQDIGGDGFGGAACSITRMYGHTFRRFPVDRILADLENIRQQGFKAVFFVDDNITFDVAHFRRVYSLPPGLIRSLRKFFNFSIVNYFTTC